LIEGSLVDLKPMDEGDFEFLYRWNNDPAYTGPYEPFEAIPELELRSWLGDMPANPLWFIMQTKQAEPVGQMRVSLEGDHAVLGYRVAPPYRGRGYCTDAVEAATRHLLGTGLRYVEAETNPRNAASRRVLEKAGFRYVERREKAVEIRGVWLEGVVYRRGV
jgi:RimJ/RimL family protein N-acetyltransferase